MSNNAANSRPAVIRSVLQVGERDESQRMQRLIPAWIISGVVHVFLLALFIFIGSPSQANPNDSADTAVIETKVEDNSKAPNFENDEIGFDPEVQTNYNVPRIEDVSVPGKVDDTAVVGIHNAPEGPPTTLPPPNGVGFQGTGAGINDPNRDGTGSRIGLAGGMNGFTLRQSFLGRSGATRVQMLSEGGGNARSEAAVARGLKWMHRHQFSDGHWGLHDFHLAGKCQCANHTGPNNDIAGTAFGLLPFLGAGQTHKASADKQNLYAKDVEKGLKYLVNKQDKSGYFGGGMYSHGLATIAICEAYGLSSDPVLKGPAQRAVKFIVDNQNELGGWHYNPGMKTSDTSVNGWQIMALKSAQMSGLEVPTKVLVDHNEKWLNKVGTPDGGGYGYSGPQASPTTTAIGLLCREYLGWGPRSPGLIKGVENMMAAGNMPGKTHGMYYYYYATQVLHHFGGAPWKKWNELMRENLIEMQDLGTTNKHQEGSYAGKHGNMHAGRLMETSLCILTLEVYYRHLPLYRRGVDGDKELK